MPGTFGYTPATNIAVVTGGTSGAPATSADFVTADRAGTGTFLKIASAPSKTYTLTYPVRPVEFRAVVVKFVVAAKTAHTDYLFITGTDAWDAAQTESIDVSAGNGTYTSTKRWRTISNISCSDAADGTGTPWADGTLAVTQDIWGVIWDKVGNLYKIDAHTNFGDGSTATYFAGVRENAYWADGINVQINTAATVRLGTPGTLLGYNGSLWNLSPSSSVFLQGGTLISYDSRIHNRSTAAYVAYNTGSMTLVNTILSATYSDGGGTPWNQDHNIGWQMTYISLDNVNYIDCSLAALAKNPDVYTYVKHINGQIGIQISANGVIASNLAVYDCANPIQVYSDGWGPLTATVKDPVVFTGTPLHVGSDAAGQITKLIYSCSIHIADKNGANLGTVVVLCRDKDGATVFNVNTDANGNIAEQQIEYKRWTGATPTLYTYSPHKFTISKAGYQTLVLENVTVSAPIKWYLELQQNLVFNFSKRVRIQ